MCPAYRYKPPDAADTNAEEWASRPFQQAKRPRVQTQTSGDVSLNTPNSQGSGGHEAAQSALRNRLQHMLNGNSQQARVNPQELDWKLTHADVIESEARARSMNQAVTGSVVRDLASSTGSLRAAAATLETAADVTRLSARAAGRDLVAASDFLRTSGKAMADAAVKMDVTAGVVAEAVSAAAMSRAGFMDISSVEPAQQLLGYEFSFTFPPTPTDDPTAVRYGCSMTSPVGTVLTRLVVFSQACDIKFEMKCGQDGLGFRVKHMNEKVFSVYQCRLPVFEGWMISCMVDVPTTTDIRFSLYGGWQFDTPWSSQPLMSTDLYQEHGRASFKYVRADGTKHDYSYGEIIKLTPVADWATKRLIQKMLVAEGVESNPGPKRVCRRAFAAHCLTDARDDIVTSNHFAVLDDIDLIGCGDIRDRAEEQCNGTEERAASPDSVDVYAEMDDKWLAHDESVPINSLDAVKSAERGFALLNSKSASEELLALLACLDMWTEDHSVPLSQGKFKACAPWLSTDDGEKKKAGGGAGLGGKRPKSPSSKEHGAMRLANYLKGRTDVELACAAIIRKPPPGAMPPASDASTHAGRLVEMYRALTPRGEAWRNFGGPVDLDFAGHYGGQSSPELTSFSFALGEATRLVQNRTSAPTLCVEDSRCNRHTKSLISAMLLASGIEPNPGPSANEELKVNRTAKALADTYEEEYAGGTELSFSRIGRQYLVSEVHSAMSTRTEIGTQTLRYFSQTGVIGSVERNLALPAQGHMYSAIGGWTRAGATAAEVAEGALIAPSFTVGLTDEIKDEFPVQLTETALENNTLTSSKTEFKIQPGTVIEGGFRYPELLSHYSFKVSSNSFDGAKIRAAQMLIARSRFHHEQPLNHVVTQIDPALQVDDTVPPQYHVWPGAPGAAGAYNASAKFAGIGATAHIRHWQSIGWYRSQYRGGIGQQLLIHGFLESVPVQRRTAVLALRTAAIAGAGVTLSRKLAVLLALLGPGAVEDPVLTVPVNRMNVGADGYPLTGARAGVANQEWLALGVLPCMVSSPGDFVLDVLVPLSAVDRIRMSYADFNTIGTPAGRNVLFPAVVDSGGVAVSLASGVGPGGIAWGQFVRGHLLTLTTEQLIEDFAWVGRFFIPGFVQGVSQGMALLSRVVDVPAVVLGPAAGAIAARPGVLTLNGGDVVFNVAEALVRNHALGVRSTPRVCNTPATPALSTPAFFSPMIYIRRTKLDQLMMQSLGLATFHPDVFTAFSPAQWYSDVYAMTGLVHAGVMQSIIFSYLCYDIGLPTSALNLADGAPWAGNPQPPALQRALASTRPAGVDPCMCDFQFWVGNGTARMMSGAVRGIITANIFGEGVYPEMPGGDRDFWQVWDETGGVWLNQYHPTAIAPWSIACYPRLNESWQTPGTFVPIPHNGPMDTLALPSEQKRFTYKINMVPPGGGVAAPRWVVADDTKYRGEALMNSSELDEFVDKMSIFTAISLLNAHAVSWPGGWNWRVSNRPGTLCHLRHDQVFYIPPTFYPGVTLPVAPNLGDVVNPFTRHFVAAVPPLPSINPGREVCVLNFDDASVITANMRLDGRIPLGLPTIVIGARVSRNTMYQPGEGRTEARVRVGYGGRPNVSTLNSSMPSGLQQDEGVSAQPTTVEAP